jgi:hypothetical protein
MKWYSYSYSIVHQIEYEYEYCPSGGVRVRKTQGDSNVMRNDVGVSPCSLTALVSSVIASYAVRQMLYCQAILRILARLCLCLICFCSSVLQGQEIPGKRGAVSKTLDGTSSLELQGDIASTLVDGVDRFLIKELASSVQKRMDQWPKPNRSDANASDATLYESATKELREELRTRLGMIDARVPCNAFIVESTASTAKDANAPVALNDTCKVFSVRWPVFEGVDATGLLVIPTGEVQFHAVVVPDAGQTPEQLCGHGDNSSDIALELAAQGAVVVIPNVVQRTREARNGRSKLTDQEFLYRSAFVLGRHVIGYQLAEISAALDALKKTYGDHPNLVAGWGEGGCLALYAAAVDTRSLKGKPPHLPNNTNPFPKRLL